MSCNYQLQNLAYCFILAKIFRLFQHRLALFSIIQHWIALFSIAKHSQNSSKFSLYRQRRNEQHVQSCLLKLGFYLQLWLVVDFSGMEKSTQVRSFSVSPFTLVIGKKKTIFTPLDFDIAQNGRKCQKKCGLEKKHMFKHWCWTDEGNGKWDYCTAGSY